MKDHIHMRLMIPPKYSVANTIGFLKGKSAIRIFREYLQVRRNFTGRHSGVVVDCEFPINVQSCNSRYGHPRNRSSFKWWFKK